MQVAGVKSSFLRFKMPRSGRLAAILQVKSQFGPPTFQYDRTHTVHSLNTLQGLEYHRTQGVILRSAMKYMYIVRVSALVAVSCFSLP
jgi:hypothetical protein